MLKNNIYNIDKAFDYPTIKAIVLKSLQKIVKEGVLKNTSNVTNDVISDLKVMVIPNLPNCLPRPVIY
jgi:hypothetical protein